jgi:hypothetical protein
MWTSNFERAGKHKAAVAIARGVPRWYTGRRYMALAPTWDMIKNMNPLEYNEAFDKMLSRLDAAKVYEDLGDGAILLCWEKPGDYCHRRRVAEWLEEELGVVIPEFGFSREDTVSYEKMTRDIMYKTVWMQRLL